MRKGYWLYDIDWILSNGHCYRSSHSLTKERLDDARKNCKSIGRKKLRLLKDDM